MSQLHRMLPGKSVLFAAAWLMFVFFFAVSPAAAVPQKLGDAAGINDHPHNLSSTGIATVKALPGETDQICIFCHTPHNASSRGPLWNRPDITSPLGGGNFPLYGEKAADFRLGEIMIDDILAAKYGGAGNEYPNGATRLCLSCHDGVTAMGAVESVWGGSISLGPMTTMVIDLATSHPVSFIYDASVIAALNDPDTGKTGTTEYTTPSVGILDDSNRVQCTACHDPHLDTNDGSYTLPMWRHWTADVNEASDYEATCSECHIGGSDSGGLTRPSPPGPGGMHPILPIP